MTAAHPHPPARHRVGWHYDADTDADVDGSDPWYWFVCDERWRMVATYRASDANPKERFVYHNAGANGYGGSSYIDSTILRDTDDTAGWASAAPDSTLQTRYYYLQNWRADVVAMVEPDGDPIEYVRYSPYGVPFVYGAGDVNRDGAVDILDLYSWDDYYYSTTGDAAVDIDINRDGAVNGSDYTLVSDQDGWGAWAASGRGFVSRLDNRKGYAGYEFDPATTQWHVRHRVLVSEMGRWGRRDPVGYVDGMSLYSYVNSNPILDADCTGLMIGRCQTDQTDGTCAKICNKYPTSLGSTWRDQNGTPIYCCICLHNIGKKFPIHLRNGVEFPPEYDRDGWSDGMYIITSCIGAHENEHMRQCGGSQECREVLGHSVEIGCLQNGRAECMRNAECERVVDAAIAAAWKEYVRFSLGCNGDMPKVCR